MAERAIILFAHGARDPAWAQPFRKIKDLLEARQPGIAVELAFLEIMEPTLAVAVAKLAGARHTTIAIAPLFMAQGGHLKNDLPKILDTIHASHNAWGSCKCFYLSSWCNSPNRAMICYVDEP